MRFAVMEDGRVANVAEASAPLAENWVASESANIGDEYIDGGFRSPPLDPLALRRDAYRNESDPLRNELEFDAWKRGEPLDLTPWYEAVEAIKARYPLPK